MPWVDLAGGNLSGSNGFIAWPFGAVVTQAC